MKARSFALFVPFVLFIFVKQKLWTVSGTEDASVERHLLRRVLSTEDNDTSPSPPCVPASMDDFPPDFMTQEQRLRGGLVFHIVVVFYMCGMLGYICDDYFVPSLEIMADSLKVPSDVAGATFMAVGTSAPELFSSVIGSFITEGDIGVGTIVGSAVFNILGVTGVVGVAVWKNEVLVDWFPITRDCTMYAITVIALIGVISNNVVEWYEALILLLLFAAYLVVMLFNGRIQHLSTLQAHRAKEKWFGNNNAIHEGCQKVPSEESPLLASCRCTVAPPEEKRGFDAEKTSLDPDWSRRGSLARSDEEPSEEDRFWSCPSGNPLRRLLWVLFCPARLLIRLTVPHCRSPRWSAVTFLLSVVWIGALSYVAVWMVSIIGYTLGIPDSVSGITILAAGTSVPEIVSSVIVARNGLGNMAVCNLIASNIFDILFCLGAPWLIKTALSPPHHSLVIHSGALTYTAVTLLSTVVLLYVTFIVARWRLNYKVGIVCIVTYAVFIVLACLYELNVFGDFSLPPC